MTVFAATPAFLTSPWRFAPPLLLAAAAVYFLLPRPRGRAVLLGAVAGVAALALAAVVCFRTDGSLSPESFLFYSFSALAVTGGTVMITQRNPARAAVCFALVVANVCGLFLLRAAPFLMAAAIIIYAGAIIVTFLFVLMLAQQTGFSDADDRSREPFLGAFAAFTLLGSFVLLLDYSFPPTRSFDDLLARIEAARGESSAENIRSRLGDRQALLDELRVEERQARETSGTALAKAWNAAREDLNAELNDATAGTKALQDSLDQVLRVGREIQRARQPKPLPAANVAGIGRLLYSDHILAVELGGALLLVATIGAIAITGRRYPEGRGMIPVSNYLVVGAILFVLGMVGFLTRRNLILMFLCAELMLQGVTLNLVAFARHHGNLHGQVFTLFVITVAACEAALALALILMLYRSRRTLDVSRWQDIREPGQEATLDLDSSPDPVPQEEQPKLTPAGAAPIDDREESYV